MLNKIFNEDCLEGMKRIPDWSIDCIITDPPYGTTACKWDTIIPFDLMWEQLKRIIKPNGAIVLFGSEPFSSALRMSNIKQYKYDWKWEKSKPMWFLQANFRPLKNYEDIIIFSKAAATSTKWDIMVYNPQGVDRTERLKVRKWWMWINSDRESQLWEYISKWSNFPRTIIKISSENKTVHPTQKPVALIEYLIKTYTNEWETVLDFTIGSGTTAIAAINTNRNYIGFEMDKWYFDIAEKRISDHI